MRILIATDSFKDALPSPDVCRAIGRGLRLAAPEADIVEFPLADGGEGSAEILVFHSRGERITLTVKDPLFRPVEASYGLSGDRQTAFIEMAQAAGLQLLRPKERNPMKTTTLGVGELVWDAMKQGAKRIVLAIGGSATNDGGTGIATALGYEFLDEGGQPVTPTGENLERIAQIDDSEVQFERNEYRIEALCDVDNPLFGPAGAAHTYAAQKGASEKDIPRLDEGLRHLAIILQEHYGQDYAHAPGAGAAGGLGAGAMAFLGAHLRPGAEAIMEYTSFDKQLREVDLVITGEGKIDGQTLRGKLIHAVAHRAGEAGIPVIALCGTLEASPEQIRKIGLLAAFSILQRPQHLDEAIAETASGLERLAFNVGRLWIEKK
jgi:glycerate 2-kinase